MKRVALFVGINDYEDPMINDLKCARNDARLLWSSKTFKDYDQAELLTDDEASPAGIISKIENLSRSLEKDDVFVFYFSGHGCEVGAEHHLLTSRTKSALIANGYETVTLSMIKNVSGKVKGLKRLFILDCCRSEVQVTKGIGAGCPNSRGVAFAKVTNRDDNTALIPPVILSSCSTGQYSYEDTTRGNGYFTMALVETLNEPLRSLSDFQEKLDRKIASYELPGPQNVCWNGSLAGDLPFVNWCSSARAAKGIVSSAENQELLELRRKVAELEAAAGKTPSAQTQTAGAAPDAGTPSAQKDIPMSFMLAFNQSIDLVRIAPGTFMMGSPESEDGRDDDEKQHEVSLKDPFWLSETPVTQKQWKSLMGRNPSRFAGDDLPVVNVSWDDAVKFCKKLNDKFKKMLPGGFHFALPTEAQWEYACRAGASTAFCYGDASDMEKMNCNGDYPCGGGEPGKNMKKAMPVKHYPANTWGIFSMHGNVFEWCRDVYEENYAQNPESLRGNNGITRVIRGGSWDTGAAYCRAARRDYASPDDQYDFVGFRVALVPVN